MYLNIGNTSFQCFEHFPAVVNCVAMPDVMASVTYTDKWVQYFKGEHATDLQWRSDPDVVNLVAKVMVDDFG